METLKINPEKLAYWYFRLNGCFTIPNFVIHPTQGRQQRSDIDIFAVRLPYRAELPNNPMTDDSILLSEGGRIKVILAEVKKDTCNLNGPWTDRNRSNMQLAIAAAGSFPREKVEEVAASIYDHGFFQDDRFTMMLFCVGRTENFEIKRKYPKVPQVTWQHILNFIYERFTTYHEQKCGHPQWDTDGRNLYQIAVNSENKDVFNYRIQIVI